MLCFDVDEVVVVFFCLQLFTEGLSHKYCKTHLMINSLLISSLYADLEGQVVGPSFARSANAYPTFYALCTL